MKIIKHTSTQLIVKQDIPWIFWLFGIGCEFVGVFNALEKNNVLAIIVPLIMGLIPFFVINQISICDFNANTEQLTIKRYGLLGIRQIKHPLSEIILVQTKSMSSIFTDHKSWLEPYRIEIVLASGKIIPLTNHFENDENDYDKQERIANQIRRFLTA
jgi:hypothetical protein